MQRVFLSAGSTVYFCSVAAAIGAPLRYHWYSNDGAGSPAHVPRSQVSVRPTVPVPTMYGGSPITFGASPAMWTSALVTERVPSSFVPVTVQLILEPRSAVVTANSDRVADGIGVPFNSHWKVRAGVGAPVHPLASASHVKTDPTVGSPPIFGHPAGASGSVPCT